MAGKSDDDDDLTIDEATAILKRHRVKGLTNRESLRRALADKRIPSKRANAPGAPYRIPAAAIGALVATELSPDADAPSLHKQVFDYFAKDPLHNPITAVTDGLLKSVDEAARLFRVYQKYRPNLHALEANRAHATWEEKRLKEASNEPPCEKCERVYFVARRDSVRLVAAVTGRPQDPYLGRGVRFEEPETELLADFKAQWFCPGCQCWRATGAPVATMKAKLAALKTADAETGGVGAEARDACEKCERVYVVARRDSARLVAAVTGRSQDPYLGRGVRFEERETELLADLKAQWFCRGCQCWRAGAPVATMKAKLAALKTADAETGGVGAEARNEGSATDSPEAPSASQYEEK